MDRSRALLIVQSVHHGNTLKVARAIAEPLDADVLAPEDIDPASLGEYDLIGFGSGIYFGMFHPRLKQLIRSLPKTTSPKPAFVFSTSGLPFLSRLWHQPLKRRLVDCGYQVIGEFRCRGFDTVGPLWLIGGINRGHPDQRDLNRAREFGRFVAGQIRGPIGLQSEAGSVRS